MKIIPFPSVNPSKKSKKLHDLFKAPLDITFKGTFEQVKCLYLWENVIERNTNKFNLLQTYQAKQHAKVSNTLLLVNIQDPKNFDSHLINRDLWRETRVRELLRNFTLWQVSVSGS